MLNWVVNSCPVYAWHATLISSVVSLSTGSSFLSGGGAYHSPTPAMLSLLSPSLDPHHSIRPCRLDDRTDDIGKRR
jgi:hypothetical protein